MIKLKGIFSNLLRLRIQKFSTPKDIEIFIDGESHFVDPRMTVFQACYSVGVVIPRFCYHEKLSIAGNCRMCLVEIEKAPKPVASCAAQVTPGMKVLTKSEKTRIARGGVMEFLLANHPLDCPICDQGGECDLQDISINYGFETGRFREYKRAVEDKNIGPLISTVMTRCIHCTRCVRFAEEVGGVLELGTVGRGKYTEISTYVEKMFTNELSGNLVDLCPVGALTNGPYAFTSRPWELKKTNSIDLMEAIIPRVEFNYRGPEIMRCLPRVNESVNDEWISDKSRYNYDGLKRQRLIFPLLRNKDSDQFEEIQWEDALKLLASHMNKVKNPSTEMAGLVGQFSNIESVTAFRDLLHKMNCDNLLSECYPLASDSRSDYLLNRSITEFEYLDNLLMIGGNLKFESPLLNARVLKGKKNGLKCFKVGSSDDLGYKHVHLGNTVQSLLSILEEQNEFHKILKASNNAHVMLSSTLCSYYKNVRSLKEFLNYKLQSINPSITIGFLHNFVGPLSGYDLGISYKSKDEVKNIKFIYNMGNDNKELIESLIQKSKDCFVVYQGSHGDTGARYANLILPSSAWTETTGTHVSTEGRVQLSRLVVPPPALAKDDWMILRALSEELGVSLSYNSAEELRFRIAQIAPHLIKYDHIEKYSVDPSEQYKASDLGDGLLSGFIDNYYKTDQISRSSVVMGKCSAAFNPEKMSNFLKKSFL